MPFKARSDAAASPRDLSKAEPSQSTWRFFVLGEIANFNHLRRALGTERANPLIDRIRDRLEEVLPALRMRTIGQRQIELQFTGDDHAQLECSLAEIRSACAEPFFVDDEPYNVAMIFGATALAHAPADDVAMVEDAEAKLVEARAADLALVQDLHDLTAHEARQMAHELRHALDDDQLLLHYQPKVNVRRQQIGSAEALIRWRHPDRGLILPSDFIPVAEKTGLITEMTLWTIRQAIGDYHRLKRSGHDIRIFINIAGQLLADPVFVRTACDLVMGGDAMLGFEITETSVIRDPASAIRHLQVFADIGIVISIDDYGAGLSSLAYLKQLPARELKIDKLFVTQLTSSNRDPLIVRSTIDLAHALEMEVVAEGVETNSALALLTVMGCDMVQGFLISRPIALDALITFLADDSHHAAPADTRKSFTRLAEAWKRA